MIKYCLCLLLLINSYVAFAQTSAKRIDTVIIDKPGKPKIYPRAGMVSTFNVYQNLSKSKEYTIFFNAIKTAGLGETFSSKGPITVFAPKDSVLNKLPAGMLDTLLKPAHKFELINFLTYQVVPGDLVSKKIRKQIKAGKGRAVLISVSGSKIIASLDNNQRIVLTDETGGKSTLSNFDLKQLNGELHAVDRVLISKYKSI